MPIYWFLVRLTEICSSEEILVRDQRENEPENISSKEHDGDGYRKVLRRVPTTNRPAAAQSLGEKSSE